MKVILKYKPFQETVAKRNKNMITMNLSRKSLYFKIQSDPKFILVFTYIPYNETNYNHNS